MKRYIGLDIGASGVKLSVFEGQGEKGRFVRFERIDTADEGILDEGEMMSAVRELLAAAKLGGSAIWLGLPQYQVTMNVADYPQVRQAELARLVAVDAAQVVGFSDEVLLHSFVPMPGGLGRKHPVMVALSREAGLRERLASLSAGGLVCGGLVPAGLALANAAFALVEGLGTLAEPVLLLDMGQENTTLVVVAGGQVLYMGTLMFSAVKFMDVAREYQTRHRSVQGEAGAEEYLTSVKLGDESAHSPLRQLAMQLESELQNAVEHWRSQELEQLANTPVTRLYVTGGGSRLGGLVPWLEEQLECHVEAFGPMEGTVMRPELTVAYGLGLQACGKAALSLSLLPRDVEDEQLRRKRWPFLAAAAALVAGTVVYQLLTSMLADKAALEALEREQKVLTEYVDIASQTRAVRRTAQDWEKALALLSLHGSRAGRVERALALATSGEALEHGWLIYLADRAGGTDQEFFVEEKASRGTFTGRQTQPTTVQTEASALLRGCRQTFVCAGYVPMSARNEIQTLIAQLDGKEGPERLFAGVDRTDGIEGALLMKWREYFNAQAPRLASVMKLPKKSDGRFPENFELFTLRLPLAQPEVNMSALEAE